jgi:hypothetical protein
MTDDAKPKTPAKSPAGFYADIIDEADLAKARDVTGIDDEIAILRIRLHQVMENNKEDYATMLKLLAGLVRAVQAAYRMSSRAADEFGANLADTMSGLHAQFFPEEAPSDA